MFQQFFNGVVQNAGSSSESSDEDSSFEEKKKRREEKRAKRPAIITQDAVNELYFTNDTIIFEVTVQNQTQWPVHIDSIKKTDPSDINFEGVEIGTALKKQETAKLSVPITMPSQPGQYEIKLGFFSKKGQTGETLSLKFNVAEDSAF